MEKKIFEFINKKSSNNKIIVVYGPTACGKTRMGIDIAKQIDSEIISTDSKQIFKYMDIGTGKVTQEEKKGIIHHMLDIITPDVDYSVGDYKNITQVIIDKLHSQNKIPILVGGTGLYIDSLIYNSSIGKMPSYIDLRNKLEAERLDKGNMHMYEKLQEIDSRYAKELHPNNYRYVIRGIEIMTLTGKSKLDFKDEKKLIYDTLFITPYDGNRELLYSNINTRVKNMFDIGLLEEVEKLINSGYNKKCFGLNSIGYKEVISYFDGEISLEECISLVQKNSRNYAKRQLTWFSRYEKNIKI